MAVDGAALACIGAGSVILYAGLKGKSVLSSLQAVIKGSPPSAAAASNPIPIASDIAAAATASANSVTLGGTAPAPSGSGTTYTLAQLEQLWVSAGGSASTAVIAAHVASAESSGRSWVTSSNPDGGTNVGLWQLDTPGGVGAGYTVAELQNPATNAAITVLATQDGRDWSHWADAVVVNGVYVGPTS